MRFFFILLTFFLMAGGAYAADDNFRYDTKDTPGLQKYTIGTAEVDEEVRSVSEDGVSAGKYMEEAPEGPEPGAPQKKIFESSKAPAGRDIFGFVMSHIHPYAVYEAQYDDNIYDVQDSRFIKTDVSHTNIGGLGYFIGNTRDTYVRLDAGARTDVYSINRLLNEYSPFLHWGCEAGFRKNRHRFFGTYLYSQRFTPTSSITAGVPGLQKYLFTKEAAGWQFLRKKFGFELRYLKNTYDYNEPRRVRSSYWIETYNATASLDTEYLPKTVFFAEYNYVKLDYWHWAIDDYDYKENNFYAGLRSAITDKVSLRAKLGYQLRNFSRNNQDSKTAYSWLGYQALLVYELTPKFSITGTAGRFGREGANSFNQRLDDGRDYSIGFTHDITRHLTSRARFIYSQDIYANNRRAGTYNVYAGLFYHPRPWIVTGVTYERGLRLSDFQNGSYKDNRCSFNVEVKF